MLKTIKTKKITAEIIEQIHSAIAQGSLKPGQQLPSERDLALQLGVSRPSLRQALQVLEHTGFVEIIHGQGVFVQDVAEQSLNDPLCTLLRGSNQIYMEMYEFRTEIETWAAGMAAANIEGHEKKKLKQIVQRMKARIEKQRSCYDLDAEFHLAIAKASGNRVYFQVAKTIFYLFGEVTRISHEQIYNTEKEQKALYDEHLSIFAAIDKKDAALARKRMNRHLKRTERLAAVKKIVWQGKNNHQPAERSL